VGHVLRRGRRGRPLAPLRGGASEPTSAPRRGPSPSSTSTAPSASRADQPTTPTTGCASRIRRS
jgi:hypothetical protein